MNSKPSAALLGVLALAACQQDPYILVSLEDGGRRDVVQPDTGVCVKTNGGVELCDGQDNDCDGLTDEDFKLDSDPRNCGKCGISCLLPGALSACELRSCKVLGCAPGFYDLNNDPKDGCEYACTPTGVEVCDNKDNDCNGQTDETFDLGSDVDNCGSCGNVCQLANAIAKCVNGDCKIQKCQPGFIDKDKQDATGCEAKCAPTNGGVEICDGVDNDCNGVVDDPGGKPIDLQTDPMNCGGCGTICVIPNATATCAAAKCAFASCSGGFVDADKDPSNGCECLPDGPEKCDGKDNDCNGLVDDGLSVGVCGSAVGLCKQGTLSCKNGVEVCENKVGPQPEMCDGKDNDCNGVLDPPACVFAGPGRERRLDEPATTYLGSNNSAQLTVAGAGSRVLAVWLDRRNGRGDVYANLSTDGGKSWGAGDIAVATEASDKLEPRVAFGGPTASSLRAYVAYEVFVGNGRDVVLRRSLDGGATWSATAQVNKAAGGDALFVRLAVLPATSSAGADKVVVCWERIAITGPVNPNVVCNLSVDSGVTFAAANSQVNATPNSAIVPELTVDGSTAYVAWQQGTSIRAARASLAGGALAFVGETSLAAGAGQLPQIATDGGGRVVVVWEDLRDPLINLRANRSTTSGASWLADGVRVDNDVVNGDSTQPRLAMRPAGRVFVTWTDTSRGKPDVYVNHSDDGGATWGAAARRVEASPLAASTSSRPQIALAPTGSNVYVAWEDYRNGAYRDIYFSLSLDNGVTWNVPDYRINESTPPGVADARSPQLWVSASRVAVLWMDNRTIKGSNLVTGPNADIYCSIVE